MKAFYSRRYIVYCTVLMLLSGLCTAGATPPSYSYTDLGVLQGYSDSFATAINDSGVIVGASTTSQHGLYGEAFVDANNTMTPLSGASNGYSVAYAINNAGQIVGMNSGEAFLFGSGQISSLGALGSGAFSVAFGLNDNGQVVGESADASNVYHAFVYSGGQLNDLGFLLASDQYSSALGINDSGVVVGSSEAYDAAASWYYMGAFYTSSYTPSSGLVSLGPVEISYSLYKDVAHAIDNSGTIIGGTCPVCPGEAYIYKNGAFTPLGVLSGDDSSYATAKNNNGQIVGASFIWSVSSAYLYNSGSHLEYIPGPGKVDASGGDRRAFLYQGGTMYDLNSLAAIPTGWQLTEADAINNFGQIVGYASNSSTGTVHAFLLTPTYNNLLQVAVNASSAWVSSPWFGYVNVTSQPFYYHLYLGFICPMDFDPTNVYFYDATMGDFIYTNQSLYPYFYGFKHQKWYFIALAGGAPVNPSGTYVYEFGGRGWITLSSY